MCLGCVVLLALHQPGHKTLSDAAHAHDPSYATGSGKEAELNLREAELHLWRIDSNSVVSSEADLKATAKGSTVDSSNNRNAKSLKATELSLKCTHHLLKLSSLFRPSFLEVVEVATSEESALRGCEDNALDRILL